jgi:hypothetical protein
MMNWKGCGRKQLWPNLRHYPNICLQGLRKTTKTSVKIAGLQVGTLNPGPPEYEAGVLITQPQRSVEQSY